MASALRQHRLGRPQRRAAYAALTLVLAMGCGFAPAGPGLPTSSLAPSATSSPSAAATPSESATASATARATDAQPTRSPTPAPTALPLDGKAELIVWGDLSERTIQIIVAVANTTGEWIELSAAESECRLLDDNGSVAAELGFDFAAPRFVAAGEVGYLVGELLCSDCPQNEFDRVESVPRYLPANVPEFSLAIENERLAVGEAGELEVTGEIINQGSLAVESVDYVAILLGARGRPIGYARTVLDRVAAGARLEFHAGSGWGRRLRPTQVGQVLSFVSPAPPRDW